MVLFLIILILLMGGLRQRMFFVGLLLVTLKYIVFGWILVSISLILILLRQFVKVYIVRNKTIDR
jgi:type IV secretory pathway TrbD component